MWRNQSSGRSAPPTSKRNGTRNNMSTSDFNPHKLDQYMFNQVRCKAKSTAESRRTILSNYGFKR